MSDRIVVLSALRPIASANSTVSAVVQDLARRAKEAPDEDTRRFLLDAANRLLGAATDINVALDKASGAP